MHTAIYTLADISAQEVSRVTWYENNIGEI